MKAFLVIVIFCFYLNSSYTQILFKQINFTSRITTFKNIVKQRDSIKRHAFISVKDSLIRIISNNYEDNYKLVYVEDLRTIIYKGQRILKYYIFKAIDKNGIEWLVQLQMRTKPKTTGEMNLVFSNKEGVIINYSGIYFPIKRKFKNIL